MAIFSMLWPAFLTPFALGAQLTVPQILSRVAEEAEVFRQKAPQCLSQETLEQRALLPPSRFRPRIGAAATQVDPLRMQIREVVSEYSVGPLRPSDSPSLVEYREVVSVDGRAVQSAQTARRALSLGVRSADERLRKRMLEEFARHGLVDIATDYGIILLAFTKRGLRDIDVQLAGEDRLGADDALLLSWKQLSLAAGELEFHGRIAARRPLQGSLWVRKSDGLPLRIQAFAEALEQKHTVRDQATVEYALSSHGFLTPVSVLHQHIVDGKLITENRYRYEPFRLFSADAEIKFTELPEPPPSPAKK